MAYSLDRYYSLTFSNLSTPHVLVYPNNAVAANLLNHHKGNSAVIDVSDCLAVDAARLPMPGVLMSLLDARIKSIGRRAIVVGIDAYLMLLSDSNVTEFMVELQNRLDEKTVNADYLLSRQNKPNLNPRYTEALSVIYISGNEECLPPLSVEAYSDKWIKIGAVVGYKALLKKLGPFVPSGNHMLILNNLDSVQNEVSNAISFFLDPRVIAERHYGITADWSMPVLETLIMQSIENGRMPEKYLEITFGADNINTRKALKRLRDFSTDNLWPAYIWMLRKRLPSNSFAYKVLSNDITHNNLLRKYAVDTAVSALSDVDASRYAVERAEALIEIGNVSFESLIVEFIEQTKNIKAALPFLNCGTSAERVEIVRRASEENLDLGLPKKYAELFPALADYFSTDLDYDSNETALYFNDYHKLKVSNTITDEFVQRAYSSSVHSGYSARDAVLSKWRSMPDTALLVMDAMGVEYMPLLLALAQRREMNIEFQAITVSNLPSETKFNSIEWDKARTVEGKRNVDNIVHDGASKHEKNTPEQNFAETLWAFETVIMNRIAEALIKFERVVVTADHGASRLAVIAHREGKGETLPWEGEGQPDDWRYSLAPQGKQRPSELEQMYFPESQKTYWIVRGYNRLPKQGGKLNELHGGASLEEQLVPVVVFTRNTVAVLPKQSIKSEKAEIVDEFEGVI